MLYRARLAARRRLSASGLPGDAAGPADAGITLIEVMIAIVIIGVVMTALTTFFTGTMTASGYQNARQTASQLADASIEKARALSATALTTGRDTSSSTSQWNAPAAGVAAYLADMTMAADSAASAGSGASPTVDPGDPARTIPALPTVPVATELKSLNGAKGIVFSQSWYIGTCYQPAGGGACVKTSVAGAVRLLRIVAAVNWTGRGCAASACSYVTATLVSPDTDPTFPAAGS
jgi:prepilin-type N-terminal cleavage/methylation domain-containing protein